MVAYIKDVSHLSAAMTKMVKSSTTSFAVVQHLHRSTIAPPPPTEIWLTRRRWSLPLVRKHARARTIATAPLRRWRQATDVTFVPSLSTIKCTWWARETWDASILRRWTTVTSTTVARAVSVRRTWKWCGCQWETSIRLSSDAADTKKRRPICAHQVRNKYRNKN